jgi:nucleotide-binding universal stress UspA family protein
MKTILLPTDFSENARNAINYAVNLFGDEECLFILLNAYMAPSSGSHVLVSVNDILKTNSEAQLSLEKEMLCEKNYCAVLDVHVKAEYGTLIDAVKKIQSDTNIDFIVMGTKGATGLKEVLIGSNTVDVIHKAKCPVIAVPENVKFSEPSKIMLAADYKAFDDRFLLQPMIDFAKKYNAKIEVVNVQKEGVLIGVDEAMQGLVLHDMLENVPHTYQFVESGDIAEGIENFIEETRPDMLAMIPRHHSFVSRLFNQSVTGKIAMHAHIPLLSLYDKKHN